MMKLRDLLDTIDYDTVICVCDDMGPHTNVAPLKEISVKSLLWELDRVVTRIYLDPADNSITIELEDYRPDDEDDYDD